MCVDGLWSADTVTEKLRHCVKNRPNKLAIGWGKHTYSHTAHSHTHSHTTHTHIKEQSHPIATAAVIATSTAAVTITAGIKKQNPGKILPVMRVNTHTHTQHTQTHNHTQHKHNTHTHTVTEPPNSNTSSNSNINSSSKKRKSHRAPSSDAGTPNRSTSSSKSQNFRDSSTAECRKKEKNELVVSEEDNQNDGEHSGLTSCDEDEDDEDDVDGGMCYNRGTGGGERASKGGDQGRGGGGGDGSKGGSFDAGTPKRSNTSRKSINFRGGSTGKHSGRTSDDGEDGDAFSARVKSMKEMLTIPLKDQGRDGGGGSERGGGRGGNSTTQLKRSMFLEEFKKDLGKPTQIQQEEPKAAVSSKRSNTEKLPPKKRRSNVVFKKIKDKLDTTLALVVASYSLATCRAAPSCVYPAGFKLQECSEERHVWMRNLVPIVEVVPSKTWEDYSWECAKNDDDGSVIEGLFVDSKGESYTSLPQLLEVIFLLVYCF
jgi:hypothetical protein